MLVVFNLKCDRSDCISVCFVSIFIFIEERCCIACCSRNRPSYFSQFLVMSGQFAPPFRNRTVKARRDVTGVVTWRHSDVIRGRTFGRSTGPPGCSAPTPCLRRWVRLWPRRGCCRRPALRPPTSWPPCRRRPASPCRRRRCWRPLPAARWTALPGPRWIASPLPAPAVWCRSLGQPSPFWWPAVRWRHVSIHSSWRVRCRS